MNEPKKQYLMSPTKSGFMTKTILILFIFWKIKMCGTVKEPKNKLSIGNFTQIALWVCQSHKIFQSVFGIFVKIKENIEKFTVKFLQKTSVFASFKKSQFFELFFPNTFCYFTMLLRFIFKQSVTYFNKMLRAVRSTLA